MPQLAHITYSSQTNIPHEHDEDAVAVIITQEEEDQASANVLFVVADGELEASRLTIESLRDSYHNQLVADHPAERLSEAIGLAHYQIWQENQTQSSKMTSSVMAAFVIDQLLYMTYLGDCHAYLFDYWWGVKPRLQQLTGEQPFAAAKASQPPFVNQQTLGLSEQIQIQRQKHHLKPGSILLLSSNNLTEIMNEPAFRALLSKSQPEVAAKEVIRLANDAGGVDHISVIVAQIGNQPPYPWLPLALTILAILLIFMLLLSFAMGLIL